MPDKLLSLMELADILGVKHTGVREWLLAHQEITPVVKNHVPHYPIDKSTMDEILGISVVRAINPEFTIQEASSHIMPRAEKGTYVVEEVPIPKMPKIRVATPRTTKAQNNELAWINALGTYVQALEKKYSNMATLSFRAYYLSIPFDLIVRCDYSQDKYLESEAKVLEDARKNATDKLVQIVRKNNQGAGDDLIQRYIDSWKFFDKAFGRLCNKSYRFGKRIVEKLSKQKSDLIINSAREGLDIKLNRIYHSIIIE
jgi:hypothetical protein